MVDKLSRRLVPAELWVLWMNWAVGNFSTGPAPWSIALLGKRCHGYLRYQRRGGVADGDPGGRGTGGRGRAVVTVPVSAGAQPEHEGQERFVAAGLGDVPDDLRFHRHDAELPGAVAEGAAVQRGCLGACAMTATAASSTSPSGSVIAVARRTETLPRWLLWS